MGAVMGIWTPLTSFVGRTADVAGVTGLLADSRLVTVTGPGGVGKTRLAIEAARRAADQFPDGAYLVGLATVADEAQVPTEVMAALGVQQDPGRPALAVLAEVLAPRRLLLILDNCEHVLPAVADLCMVLLRNADEVRVLATSREQIGITGESQYRLAPLELPSSGDPAVVGESAAAALFVERAGGAGRRFTISPRDAALVARVVTRLDGMPLAIELAAARVEALGLAELAMLIDDVLPLMTGEDGPAGDRPAGDRHRSLAAVADWSYQQLTEPEQRVFRQLAVFPGSFTLKAAEAVAGPDAGLVVLRLVDCSLLIPPRPGPDQRARYRMLQILRAYGLTRLREAGEERDASAALAAFAWSVAVQASAGLRASDQRELDALRWLDAEDATLSHALDWGLQHDPGGALRLATLMAPWLSLRGRLTEARTRLDAAAARSAVAGETWARAQLWLGYLSSYSASAADGMDHYTAAVEGCPDAAPSRTLVEALAHGRAIERLNHGDLPGAVHDARRALALARELADVVSELIALTALSVVVFYGGDAAEALELTRRARELLPSDIPGDLARWCHYALAQVLAEMGELDSARRVCAAGLALARQVDDLANLVPLLGTMGDIQRLAGSLADAGAHLREGVALAARTGQSRSLANLIEQRGYLCAAAGDWANAATLWSAATTYRERNGQPTTGPVNADSHAGYARQMEQALTPGELRAARERGARMQTSAAVELASIAGSQEPAPGRMLSPRERELVTLVAQGRTNAEIAAGLHISVRTVASHLDRIRDKTGHRRRADLTRLAIEENLV